MLFSFFNFGPPPHIEIYIFYFGFWFSSGEITIKHLDPDFDIGKSILMPLFHFKKPRAYNVSQGKCGIIILITGTRRGVLPLIRTTSI